MVLSGAKFGNHCAQVINAFPTKSKTLWRTVGRNYINKMVRFVPNYDDFETMTLFGIFRQFTENIPATIAWCRQKGLLAQRMLCERLHVDCIEGALNRCQDGVRWRCPQCPRRFNIRKGSFIEGSKLRLWQIIGLTYFWSLDCGRTRGLSQKQVLKELEIKSEHTVVDWKNSAAMSVWSIFSTIHNRLADLAALWRLMRACSPRGDIIAAEFFLRTGYSEDMARLTKKGSWFQFLEGMP